MIYTVHAVLAGAYRGRRLSDRTMLLHASSDGGEVALCGINNLCDLAESALVTCARCQRRLAAAAKRIAKVAP